MCLIVLDQIMQEEFTDVEEESEAYKITPLVRGGISSNQIDSKINLGDQRELLGVS